MSTCRCVKRQIQYLCGCLYACPGSANVPCGLTRESRPGGSVILCRNVAPTISHLSHYCPKPTHQRQRFYQYMWKCCMCLTDGVMQDQCSACQHSCCLLCTQGAQPNSGLRPSASSSQQGLGPLATSSTPAPVSSAGRFQNPLSAQETMRAPNRASLAAGGSQARLNPQGLSSTPIINPFSAHLQGLLTIPSNSRTPAPTFPARYSQNPPGNQSTPVNTGQNFPGNTSEQPPWSQERTPSSDSPSQSRDTRPGIKWGIRKRRSPTTYVPI